MKSLLTSLKKNCFLLIISFLLYVNTVGIKNYNDDDILSIRKSYIITENRRLNLRLHSSYYTQSYFDEESFEVIDYRTGLLIQVTLVLSDILNLEQTLSPMNLLTCFDYNKKEPYNVNKIYTDIEDIFTDLDIITSFLKKYGSQLMITFPYKPIDFSKKCDLNFVSSLPSFIKILFITLKDENTIKNELLQTGSLFVAFNAPKSFFEYSNKLYYSYEISEKKIEWVFLRMIGWVMIDDVDYYIFTYVGNEEFGNWNTILIKVKLIEEFHQDFYINSINLD